MCSFVSIQDIFKIKSENRFQKIMIKKAVFCKMVGVL